MMLLEGMKAERELVVPGSSWCSHELSPALGGCRQGLGLQAGLTAGRAHCKQGWCQPRSAPRAGDHPPVQAWGLVPPGGISSLETSALPSVVVVFL